MLGTFALRQSGTEQKSLVGADFEGDGLVGVVDVEVKGLDVVNDVGVDVIFFVVGVV